MADTFIPIAECIPNQALPVEKGLYVVTAITADGESPFCAAFQNGFAPSDRPIIFPTPSLACVNYFISEESITHAFFTWDAYDNAIGYNVYTSTLDNPTEYSLERANIGLTTLEIVNQNVIVTAITPDGETPKCAAITYSSGCPEAQDFLDRVADGGGITPPIEEQLAICEFITGMKEAGLWEKMYAINHFSPNGRITCETWLKGGVFPDVWTWDSPSNIPFQTRSSSGLEPAGLTSNTGVAANSIGWTQTNCGFTGYAGAPLTRCFSAQNTVVGNLFGARVISDYNLGAVSLSPWAAYTLVNGCVDYVFGSTDAVCYKWGSDFRWPAFGGTPEQYTNGGCGFYSMNRLDNSVAKLYYGASNSPHAMLFQTVAGNNLQVPDGPVLLFREGVNTNNYSGYCSFMAFHDGLTEAESATLFGLVQAFRVALGGGYV